MSGSIEGIERTLGIALPSPAKRFLIRPKPLVYLDLPLLEELHELKLLYPAVPMRVFPIFETGCGDH